MKRMQGMLVAILLSACSTGGGQPNVRSVVESSDVARAGDPECDRNHPAFIEAGGVGAARLLGGTKVPARTVNDPDSFVTNCDVPLTLVQPDHGQCIADAHIRFNGAWLSIDRKEQGNFVMRIEWPLDPAANFTVDMEAGRGGLAVPTGPTDYLVGIRKPDDQKYFVYFQNTIGGANPGSLPLRKTYWIQVYVKDPATGTYLCPTHMPDHSSQDGYKLNPSTEQAGTGGGIEPGRRQ